METVWIHKGFYGFGGGNNNLIHGSGGRVRSIWNLKRLLYTRRYTSLDAEHAFAEEWISAQIADDAFISYARDNPTREDIAESFLYTMLYVTVLNDF